ncbi:MAG: G5 domain-containing protein [Chloroflexi bacterium]|nr:G5 domain-containing protein [Chloroflexota bacterium]
MKTRLILLTLCLLAATLTGCRSPQFGGDASVTVNADGAATPLTVEIGTTVAQALAQAGISVGNLDTVEPPLYAVLNDGDTVKVTRVVETFVTEEIEIPFEKQVVRSDAIAKDETRLLTSGENGLKEETWRVLTEDGVETSRRVVKTVILKEAVAEITMVGAQSAFAPLPIPGRVVLLAGGNAWVMEGTTGNRKPLVTTGDLDGRVFSLSPTGEFLLFTRKSKKPISEQINTLWVVRANGQSSPQQVSGAVNIVHFAGWAPTTTPTFGYSTVEPRAAAPGWQANNDFYSVTLSGSIPATPRKLIEANGGGLYGWWGITFAWGYDGRLVYARPDEVGIVDQETGLLRPLLEITPLQTNSDWAWIPPLGWAPEARTIFVVTHAPAPAPLTAEGSPYFDLTAVSMINDGSARLVQNIGMFAYPSASPVRVRGDERTYQVAYLQAVFPDQSETSRYRVFVMDRDGSGRRAVFPPTDAVGIEPQVVAWSPQPIEGQAGDFFAVVYRGNLWLVDSGNGQAFQVTNDGLLVKIDWK